MSALAAEAFAIVRSAAFAGEARHTGQTIEVRLSGTADGPANASLDAFLDSVHREGRQRAVGEVRVDLEAVEFMSSSSLKALVAWIGTLHDLPAAERYRIRFRMNPAARWQRRSLHALSMFGGDLVVVE